MREFDEITKDMSEVARKVKERKQELDEATKKQAEARKNYDTALLAVNGVKKEMQEFMDSLVPGATSGVRTS